MCIVEYTRYIYRHLADKQSRMVYMDRLNYSLTGDMNFIEDLVDKTIRQSRTWRFFCESLRDKASNNEMIIFGAGIWGNILYQETRELIQWKGVIDRNPQDKCVGQLPVYFFEDFVELYDGEVVVLSSFKNTGGMLRQLKDAGIPNGKIIDAGSIIYELTEKAIYFDIDDFAKGRRIIYIKMDIEGAEAEALRGAARVIKEQKPKLAISVYHKERDIWEIPALILSYCPEYKFYLRHYSFSWYDTVLYAAVEEAGNN